MSVSETFPPQSGGGSRRIGEQLLLRRRSQAAPVLWNKFNRLTGYVWLLTLARL